MRPPQIGIYLVVAMTLVGDASADDIADAIRMLKGSDPQFRAMGAEEVGRIGPKAEAAIPDLISALGDTRAGESFTGGMVPIAIPMVRQFAMDALVSIGPKAIPALTDAMLADPKKKVRIGAVLTMNEFVSRGNKSRVILDALSKAIGGTDRDMRRYAIQGLGRMGPEGASALPRLAELLKQDPDEWVRYEAIAALGEINPEGDKIIPSLTGALRDQSPNVKGAAAGALGRLGEKAKPSVPDLMAMLKDTSDRDEALTPDMIGMRPVRSDVIEALGKIGPVASAALPALWVLLKKDDDASIRVVAAQAVIRIDPLDFQGMPAILKELASLELREEDGPRLDAGDAALDAVEELGPKAGAAVPVLLKLLAHKFAYLRERAARALGEVGDESVFPNLVDAHNDQEAWVREAADGAMKRIRERKK